MVRRISLSRYTSVITCVAYLTLSGCLSETSIQKDHSASEIISIFTNLTDKACEKIIDHDDPNSVPYNKCPGVSGYSLLIRRVGSGRKSIDVETPTLKQIPLDYQNLITTHMSHLDNKAEWRVKVKNEKKIPIALIIRVFSHENQEEPERVTHSYLAVSKFIENEICVTNKILENSLSQEQVYMKADLSQQAKCLKTQPSSNGVVESIR